MAQNSAAWKATRVALIVGSGAVAVYIAVSLVSASNAPTNTLPGSTGGASIALAQAAAAGDVNEITRQLSNNADINAREVLADGVPMSPLLHAASAGRSDAVATLLNSGARANDAIEDQKDGRTALMLAAFAGGPGGAASVRALVAAGARIEARAHDNWTALMFAASRGTPEAVDALVKAGASLEQRNRFLQTALMLAVAPRGEAAVVKALLDAGADINATDVDGASPLILAAAALDEPDVLNLLIARGANVNAADQDGVTPLMRAADRAKADFIQLLLAAGASPAAKDRRGWTALTWAENRGDELGAAVLPLLQPAANP
ncbi:MAG: hypothetical protein C0475_04305 [Planctomyces sp.]|nr:hypothetical protein [Planctomyces sp.]